MPTYTLELKLHTKRESDLRYLENYFREVARLSNTVRRFAIRQLELLSRDPAYKTLLAEYRQLEKGKEKTEVSHQLSVMVSSYGLTKYGLQKSALDLRRHFTYVHADVYQKVCDSVWKGVEKVLYQDGKRIHFKRWEDFCSFEGKKNSTGIIYQDGKVYINCTPKHQKGGIVLSVTLPKNQGSDHWKYETTCLCDPTKYCRIVRKKFSTGWRYYVQLVQEGIPPQKHPQGTGRIGVDIGTSTVATASDTACHLEVLGGSIDIKEKEIRRIQRKLDRSRRVANPQNYKPDGTIKMGKKRWIYSRRYQKLRDQLKALRRKRAAALKQWQEQFANTLLEEGDTVYVEKMNFKGLQKRAKKTEKREDGRYKRKKRFGHSIQNRAPAQFLSILERKLSYTNGQYLEVETQTFRASQYDHVTDTYKKKKLSRRYHTVKGVWVQRDLYSAFLLKNADGTLTHADRTLCLQTYALFQQLHDACILALKTSNRKLPSSFGIQ